MKKIMFNDRYGLTKAVIGGRKTMTRRIIPIDLYNQTDWKAFDEGKYDVVVDGDEYYHDIRKCGMYQIGEEVAVAQSYHDIEKEIKAQGLPLDIKEEYRKSKAWGNKMFVKPSLMPHRIRITDIKVERLQDISDEDCMKEGIMEGEFMNTWDTFYFDMWGDVPNHITFKTPHAAFASLIDRISGKGTWERNPWVYAYEFELIK